MKLNKPAAFILPAAAAILAGLFLIAQADIDPDGDGIPNVFEFFFGIEGDSAAPDADPDQDGSSNLAEKTVWTDPLSPDTDMDGFSDSLDADPVSRALYFWGEPRFTYGETNAYTRPLWAGHGIALGGSHVEYPGFGHAWALEPDLGCLLMPVDRLVLTNDLWVAVSAGVAGFMAVDMLDSNLVSVAPAVGLALAGDTWYTNRIPLSEYPGVQMISLQVTQGVAHVFASMLYVDTDGNGFDDAQDAQLQELTGSPLANMTPAPLSGSAQPASTNAPLSQVPFLWHLGFEQAEGYVPGPVRGVQGWAASNGVEVISGQAFEGEQSLLLSRADQGAQPLAASRQVPVSLSGAVIWGSVRTRIAPGGWWPSPGGAAAVAFDVDSRLLAYDGSTGQWIPSVRTFGGASNGWTRIDIRMDFGTRTYTVCCEGVATHRDLAFPDPSVTGLSRIMMRNGRGGESGLDALVVSDREPEGIDFDGDGLPNAQERAAGTDLWSGDTDGDGISDAVEAAMGWNPLVPDADPDGDGIPTSEETARFATDPAKIDSDNDGTPDLYPVADIPGSAFTEKSGAWTVQGSAVTASEGSLLRLAYDVSLPSPGFYLVSFTISNVTASAAVHSLTLWCDDAPVASFAAPVSGVTAWQAWTPWLPGGVNRLRLSWIEDSAAGRRISVQRLLVQGVDAGLGARSLWCALNPGSADADLDGLSDAAETGTNMTYATRMDSDSDLLADGDEVSVFGLDPLLPDTDNDGTPDGTVASFRTGVATAARYLTHISTAFTDAGDSLVWANSTASSCAYDLTVATPGFYVLEIQARNFQYDPPANYRFTFNASLLDRGIGSVYVAGDIDRAGKGRLITPWLPAGVHRFKISWANRVASGSRISRPALDFIRLLAVDGADADNDGIQDWMEARLAATTADSDGDGILDRDEVRLHHSNPLNADTDFDGLSDKAELTAGTSLTSSDTDNDGVSDAEEIRIGTNPLTQSFGTAWTPLAVKAGCEADKTEGQFFRDASMLVAYSRGAVEYVFDLAADEKPVLRLSGRHEWRGGASGTTPVTCSDFLVYAGGQFVGRYWLRDAEGSFDAVLPFLKAGTQRVRIVWNGVDANLGLRIASVGIGSLGGADANADGIADWVTTSSARTNFAFKTVIASPLSPACVEGSSRWPELVAGTFAGSNVTVRPAVAGRWYADLVLDPSGSASPFALSFENGACTSAVSVSWSPLDLVNGVTSLNARLGDTLRLGVLQAGSAVLTAVNASGTVISSATVAQAVPIDVPLSLDGTWTFTTVWTPPTGSPVTRTLTVNVYGGSLPSAVPACQLGRARNWLCSGFTPGVKLEAASGLTVSLSGNTNASLNVSSVYMDHYVLLRAGAGGPVLDSRRIVPFWIQTALDCYARIIEVRPTSQVWEHRMISFGVPPDAEIEIRVYVAGVTFDDLSLVRTVQGATLNQAGEYFFRLVHPNAMTSSTCHTISTFQDGVLLGGAYFSGIGVPADLKQPAP